MKNTEKDYRDQIKTSGMSVEKANQEYTKKPAVTLPIIDESKKKGSKKNIEKTDAIKEAEGNNYTAAENEHQENSTL
jgi:hypothetical protein